MRISDWSSDVCSSDLHSTIWSATAARPRPIPLSRNCGSRPAKRRRWSPASSSAGAHRGGRSQAKDVRWKFWLKVLVERIDQAIVSDAFSSALADRVDASPPTGPPFSSRGCALQLARSRPPSYERVVNLRDAGLIGEPFG